MSHEESKKLPIIKMATGQDFCVDLERAETRGSSGRTHQRRMAGDYTELGRWPPVPTTVRGSIETYLNSFYNCPSFRA